ncbi:IQ and AAA domain-containing protein 1-like [Centruroides sculpturatus]|uniref:IQ and AAA domain-containing protein 1-like n=1 Tax=Centruroides sculpturatus TaxID=218467 RepID=UPI000C6E166C|nr:IQ and AAA domain-containing protein 1-like [Centruroides sculpturatus]
MSNKLYQSLWKDVQNSLRFILDDDKPVSPEKDLQNTFNRIAILYLRYIKIVKNLEKCYDQIIQPQKILTFRKILEGVIGRILELKAELVKIENQEFHFINNLLLDMRMIPKDLELPIPKWYLLPKEEEVEIIYQKGFQKTSINKINKANNDIIECFDDAAVLIQNHERSRQCRAKYLNVRIKKKKDNKMCSSMEYENAAFLIQKNWKLYSTRKKNKVNLIREKKLLGMLSSTILPADIKTTYNGDLEQHRELQHKMKAENLKLYEKSLVDIKMQIRLQESDDMKEKLKDDIRKWYLSYRSKHSTYPNFPSEKEGGSNLIFHPQTVEQNKTPENVVTSHSSCVPLIIEGCLEYKTLWENQNEINNDLQLYEKEMIRQQKFIEVKEEVRMQVDEIMRFELEVLKVALAKDKGIKLKKRKGKVRGKKTKKKRDLTADRSLESLYKELLDNGIIIKSVPTSLDDYFGDYNFIGSSLLSQGIEPVWHYCADIKHIIIAYCILPLSNPNVHKLTPLIKSILFFGPHGVGKKFLVNAICSATQSIIFDLSPENIIGKYPGKAGSKMLMHLVEKVGKAFQPAVVIVKNAEKSFMRKLPKTDKSDPKQLKKHLISFVKSIKPSDRILLCGITDAPFNVSDMKGLNATYQKIIYVPPPEFGSRQIIWKNLILQAKGEITPQLHLPTLSKISDGYTGSQIKLAVQKTLISRRIGVLKEAPLSEIEFIEPLSKYVPLYNVEIEAYKVK